MAFSPASIANLSLFEADSLGLSDGDPVSTWTATGVANSATASTTARPTYTANAIAGAKPALLFDGAANYLTLATPFAGTPSFVFVVLKPTDAGTLTIVSGDNASLQYRLDNYKQRLVKAGVADMGFATNAMTAAAWSLTGVSYSSPNAAFYLNGAANGTLSSAQSFASLTIRIGVNNDGMLAEFFKGYIAAIAIATRVLSAAEVKNVQKYFNRKYALFAGSTAFNRSIVIP